MTHVNTNHTLRGRIFSLKIHICRRCSSVVEQTFIVLLVYEWSMAYDLCRGLNNFDTDQP